MTFNNWKNLCFLWSHSKSKKPGTKILDLRFSFDWNQSRRPNPEFQNNKKHEIQNYQSFLINNFVINQTEKLKSNKQTKT